MRLAKLIQEILNVNEEARRIWEKEPTVHIHPDGDKRGIRFAGHEDVTTVEIIALAPLRAAEFRVVFVIPC
jgi:hypothetical protein